MTLKMAFALDGEGKPRKLKKQPVLIPKEISRGAMAKRKLDACEGIAPLELGNKSEEGLLENAVRELPIGSDTSEPVRCRRRCSIPADTGPPGAAPGQPPCGNGIDATSSDSSGPLDGARTSDLHTSDETSDEMAVIENITHEHGANDTTTLNVPSGLPENESGLRTIIFSNPSAQTNITHEQDAINITVNVPSGPPEFQIDLQTNMISNSPAHTVIQDPHNATEAPCRGVLDGALPPTPDEDLVNLSDTSEARPPQMDFTHEHGPINTKEVLGVLDGFPELQQDLHTKVLSDSQVCRVLEPWLTKGGSSLQSFFLTFAQMSRAMQECSGVLDGDSPPSSNQDLDTGSVYPSNALELPSAQMEARAPSDGLDQALVRAHAGSHEGSTPENPDDPPGGGGPSEHLPTIPLEEQIAASFREPPFNSHLRTIQGAARDIRTALMTRSINVGAAEIHTGLAASSLEQSRNYLKRPESSSAASLSRFGGDIMELMEKVDDRIYLSLDTLKSAFKDASLSKEEARSHCNKEFLPVERALSKFLSSKRGWGGLVDVTDPPGGVDPGAGAGATPEQPPSNPGPVFEDVSQNVIYADVYLQQAFYHLVKAKKCVIPKRYLEGLSDPIRLRAQRVVNLSDTMSKERDAVDVRIEMVYNVVEEELGHLKRTCELSKKLVREVWRGCHNGYVLSGFAAHTSMNLEACGPDGVGEAGGSGGLGGLGGCGGSSGSGAPSGSGGPGGSGGPADPSQPAAPARK